MDTTKCATSLPLAPDHTYWHSNLCTWKSEPAGVRDQLPRIPGGAFNSEYPRTTHKSSNARQIFVLFFSPSPILVPSGDLFTLVVYTNYNVLKRRPRSRFGIRRCGLRATTLSPSAPEPSAFLGCAPSLRFPSLWTGRTALATSGARRESARIPGFVVSSLDHDNQWESPRPAVEREPGRTDRRRNEPPAAKTGFFLQISALFTPTSSDML